MQDFIKEYNYLITFSVEILSAIVGLFCYIKYKNTIAKYLIFFLIYVVFVDLIGGYPKYFRDWGVFFLIENTLFEKNYWWYIIFWFVGLATFLTFINYRVLDNKNYKIVLKYCYYAYVVQLVCYSVFNFKGLFNPTEIFLKITCLWMIFVAVFLYLLDILQSIKITFFYKSIYFYINIAVLLWIVIISPMMFYEIYYSTEDWNFILLKRQIYLSVNVIFYLTLTIALICCKPEIK